MTVPLLSSFAARLRATCIAFAGALLFALCGQVASAADVLVVTDSHHPVQSTDGARVIELDLPERIEAELAAGLPNDPSRAAALVQQRLRDGSQALQRRIGSAYQGVADAWGLGIAKLPAVVVDRRYVVYGEPDVTRAVARVEAYRRTQP
jgi:integrating conjugative element protein (TIGR03757 family)